jgi:RNA polymerase sigma factor (sigma-70 family)
LQKENDVNLFFRCTISIKLDSLDLYWKRFKEKGDERCFSVIYNRLVDDLFSYGISMGFQKENCKDAIQDTFYKLYVSRERLQEVQNITAYIFRMFKNRLLYIKGLHKEKESIEQYADTFSIQVTILDDLIDSEKKELVKNKIERMLNSLSDNQKEVVYLKYMIGLQHREIAEILGIQEDSARKQLHRIIKKLRDFSSENNLPEELALTFLLLSLFS